MSELLEIAKQTSGKETRTRGIGLSDEQALELILAYSSKEIGHYGLAKALEHVGFKSAKNNCGNLLGARLITLIRNGKVKIVVV